MGSSNIYQNLMQEHSGYRKPPPPPPTEEDNPPELPPRNYRNKEASQSDSQLLPPRHNQQQFQPVQEESHENYVQKLRNFSRRFSEQQSASMVYLSSKTQTHITQSFPKPEVKSFEATSPLTAHSPSSSVSQESPKMSPQVSSQSQTFSASFTQPTSQVKNISPASSHQQSPSSSSYDINNEKISESRHHRPSPQHSPPPPRHPHGSPRQSPPSVLRQIGSPDPPPPPTPFKEDVEIDPELPPPPPEILEDADQHQDGFSDDSYLAHKSKGDTRQIGTYKRSSTTGDVNKLQTETNNNKVKDIQKPPRKRLLQQAWQPSNSQSETSSSEHDSDGHVPRFTAAESHVNPHVVKSVAKPLEKNHIQQRPLGNSISASALMTPRPFIASSDNSHSHSADKAERPSVRDLTSNYEKKSTPNRHTDRYNSPKLIPRAPGNINNSRSNLEQKEEGFEPRKFSYDNSQLSESKSSFNDSVHEGSSRLSLDNDPSKYSSPRRTSFPPERNKIHNIGHFGPDNSQDKVKNHSNLNGDMQSPLREQQNSHVSSHNSSDRSHPYHHARGGSGDQSYNHGKGSSSDKNHSYHHVRSSSGDPNHSYHHIRGSEHDNNNSKSHKSFTSNHERHSHERKRSSDSDHKSPYSAKDQESGHVRQRSQEEIDCDEKVSELVKKDESLKQVLQVDNKARMDFMNGLFSLNEPVRLNRSPNHSPQSSCVKEDKPLEKKEEQSPIDPSSLPADYFKSSPKAKIEMDMRGNSEKLNQEMSQEITDPDTLIKTKEELVKSIQKKVEKLKEGKAELQKELDEVDQVGQRVVGVVQEKCRTQQEKDKFSSYITDMEKIIKLLLKLSGLLARAENALQSLPDNSSPSVKKLAVDKRDRLQDQHEEAKTLKEDIDKRSAQVSVFLQDCLTDAEFEDYKYFVQMKSKLTIEMQEFEDKITLGQEQILGLKRNIPEK